MSFWKNLFNPAAEPSTEPKKRVWPLQYLGKDLPSSPEGFLEKGFIYSRVFELNREDQDVYKRRYMYIAARHRGKHFDRDDWSIIEYTFDGDAQNTLKEVRTHDYQHSDRIVDTLINFEKRMTQRGNTPVVGTTENFSLFASQTGRYLTKENRVVIIDSSQPVTENISFPRKIADRLYSVNGTCDFPLSSWEGFYQRYVDVLNEDVFADAIAEARSNKLYNWIMQTSLKNFTPLKSVTKHMSTDPQYGLMRLRNSTHAYSNYKKLFIHDYLARVSAVVAYLRTGAWVIENMPDTVNGELNKAKIGILTTLRDNLTTFMQDELEIKAGEAQKICDIMLKGSDPRGPDLPMESFYAKYPALPPVEPAPEAKEPPAPPPPPPPSRFSFH